MPILDIACHVKRFEIKLALHMRKIHFMIRVVNYAKVLHAIVKYFPLDRVTQSRDCLNKRNFVIKLALNACKHIIYKEYL